ncbi:hypothetical protein H5410_009900 [Solanum commersonii]|uniref:Uncharacterized protein n=1 Tax=Solanum commersonii TaxID=4109 RepID=A0A9J6AKT4_SOLCO|nr:hypothetical protein H5410_009900 [Solanum commersonii]
MANELAKVPEPCVNSGKCCLNWCNIKQKYTSRAKQQVTPEMRNKPQKLFNGSCSESAAELCPHRLFCLTTSCGSFIALHSQTIARLPLICQWLRGSLSEMPIN